jgi:hypothetical protein
MEKKIKKRIADIAGLIAIIALLVMLISWFIIEIERVFLCRLFG